MDSRFEFRLAPLGDLYVAKRKATKDQRGSFSRLFCTEEFNSAGLSKPILQINHSLTKRRGTVRGLHFQHPPYAEYKIVTCLRGEVYDVAVDIRRGSPTFLKWHGEILTRENGKSLLIPEGFAHGFQTLTDECELLYLHTAPYKHDKEEALNVSDPRIGILWPLPIGNLSERDRSHPFVGDDFEGIIL